MGNQESRSKNQVTQGSANESPVSPSTSDTISIPLPSELVEEDSIEQPQLSSRFVASQILIHDPDTTGSQEESSVLSLPQLGRFNSSMTKPKLRLNNQSSFANVSNGITGTHIASRISKIAAKFWMRNMEHLDMEQQLEIGCSIFLGAFSTDTEIKDIMDVHCTQKNKSIAQKSLKYLDMIGWLLRNLLRDDIDLYALLAKLGTFHQNMGVKMRHLDLMLQSMHETFSYYFPQQYNVAVKYAMDEIFTVTAQIMTGQDLGYSSYMTNITKAFMTSENDMDFLQNLRVCLQSCIGKEYFYQYLKQTFCDETVLFLQTISEFKAQSTAIQRFMIARDIIKTSIDPDAHFTINLSFDVRNNALVAMEELERQYRAKQQLNIDSDFFAEVEDEIYRLISANHWAIFKHNMKVLQSKSFGF